MFAKISADRETMADANREASAAAPAATAAQRGLMAALDHIPLSGGTGIAAGVGPGITMGDVARAASRQPQPTTAQTAAAAKSDNIGQYVQALSGLIPTEVLTLHALTLTVTTTVLAPGDATHKAVVDAAASGAEERQQMGSAAITAISAPGTLEAAFWGLIALSILLYLVPRGYMAWKSADPAIPARHWYRRMRFVDWIGVAIPPLSFLAWTMLQRTTAFDAAFPHVEEANRTVIGLFLAVVLVAVSGWIAFKPVEAAANPINGEGRGEAPRDDGGADHDGGDHGSDAPHTDGQNNDGQNTPAGDPPAGDAGDDASDAPHPAKPA